MNQQNDVIEIDLREIVLLIGHHLLAIIATTVAAALAAGLISVFALTPMYTSTSQIYILTNSGSVVSLTDLQMGSSLANDYEELIKSRPVVEQVAKNLDLELSYEALLSCVTVTNKDNTRIIRITASYTDPLTAKEIANEFAEVSRKQISKIMMVEEPTIVESAVEAERQSSPNNRKNVIIGVLVGLILSIGVIIIRYLLDDTVKTADDVEKYLGLHTLAAIPDEGGTDNSEKKRKKKFHGIRKG